jgi:hypothetical protein
MVGERWEIRLQQPPWKEGNTPPSEANTQIGVCISLFSVANNTIPLIGWVIKKKG